MGTPRRKSPTAPAAPNIIPTHKRGVPVTPLTLLKRELKSCAGLLNALPVNLVEMVAQHDLRSGGFLNHKILLGSILDEKQTQWKLWGFMAADTRKASGLPEIKSFASHPQTDNCKQYSADVVLEEGELREEFQLLKHERNALAVVLKACFIMKGAELPQDVRFTPRFLKALRHVCRKYQSDTAGGEDLIPSSPARASDNESSLQLREVKPPRVSMRKSEQRSLSDQIFGALSSPCEQRPAIASIGAQSRTVTYSMHKADENSAGALGKYNGDLMDSQKQGLASAVNKPRTDSGKSDTNASSSALHIDMMGPTSTKTPGTSFPGPVATGGLQSNHSPRAANPMGPASMRALNEYLELHRLNEDLDGDITNIKISIGRVNERFGQQRASLRKYTDNDIPHMHGEERRKALEAVVARQLKEVQQLKAQYAKLKQDQEQEKNVLAQEHEVKLGKKHQLQNGLEQKRKHLTMGQLLDFIHQQHGTSKKRKRDSSACGKE